MLDQTNISLSEDFAASQIDLDLLSYQNVMPYRLKYVFEALKTILPSSIESERTFSVTGFCITKLRCSLGDQSLNALVFLKTRLSEKYTKNCEIFLMLCTFT